eukprot:TRINITY_DN91_c1_g1_i1.p3 TRINITY_DN91_c1_g1~~TRINITY_DN91_c1_g1_i1.p3  ORF type:complete len:211 (-),score=44.21 TRINITY_DN91_c1_g1_i1:311-943(-)
MLKRKSLLILIYKAKQAMARGVTTEWEDIHVKLGNYLPREKEPTTEELSKKAMEKAEDYDPLDKKDLKELDELEDDLEEDYLKEYRKKRMEELKVVAKKPYFGRVIEISKQDYVAEVTNAPKEVFVVISLYQGYIQESLLLNKYLEQLAAKHTHIKFIKMVATKCVEKFSDANCPSMLIYRNGTVYKQLIPLKHFVLLRDLSCKGIDFIV